MGLSWNPMSWTPSNLAEEAVEFVTGSEAAGDIVGLAMASMTGDVKGVAEQGADLGQNVLAGGKKLLDGFGSALKDAFQVFSNPGAVKQPEASQCTCGGYAPGEAASQTDTGPIGKPPPAPATSPAQSSSGDPAIDAILGGSGSLEDKIFALLMHLQKEKKTSVNKSMQDYSALSKKSATASAATQAAGDGASKEQIETSSKLSADKDVALQDLQKQTGELAQLTQLTTGLMDSFKKMKDSVIQNIR